MRVKYDIDMNKITSWIESSGGVSRLFKDEYEIVWIGYIIKYNLIDYLLKNDYLPESKDFDKLYGEVLPNESLTKEAIHWLEIGTDFMLTNYREYTIQMFLQESRYSYWERENKIMRQYVIDNKEEFPEAYLEMML